MRSKYLASFIQRSRVFIQNPNAPLLTLFLTIYIFTAGGHFYVIDQALEYVTVQALAQNGNLNIAFALPLLHSLGLTSSGGWNGQLAPYVPDNASTYYSFLGVLQPILSLPFYYLGTLFHVEQWRTIAIMYTPVISAISVCLVFSIARRLGGSTRTSLILSLMYGLATIAWPYSKFYFDVSTATVTLLAAAYFLFDPNPNLKSDFVCGLFATLSVFARTSQAIMLPGFAAYLLYRHTHRRGLLVFLTPIVLGAVLFGYLNWSMFGSPFNTGYGVLTNPFSATGQQPAYSTNYILGSTYGLLFSTGEGLFIFSPLCAIGLFVLLAHNRDRGQRLVLGWFFFADLIFFASYILWAGGGGWGARYLVVTTPFLILAIEPFVRTAKASIGRTLMLLVAGAWGFFVNLLGVLVNFDYVGAYLYEVGGMPIVDWTTAPPGPDPLTWNPAFSPIRGAWDLLWSPVYPMKWYSNLNSMFFLRDRLDLYFYTLFGVPALAIFVCLAFAELFWLVKATSRETEHELQNT